MAARVSARLTRSEGRRFGLTVGGVFLALGGISLWRGHSSMAPVLGLVGGALVLGGLVFPDRLGPVVKGWYALAQAISRVTTPIFMGIVYFVVITPTGLIMRCCGKNALIQKERLGGYWAPRSTGQGHSSDMERMF